MSKGENIREMFSSILAFVEDLHTAFPEGDKAPTSLFYRLISQFKSTDEKGMVRCNQAFASFLSKYQDLIITKELSKLPPNVKILYNDRIYINISHYVAKSDIDTLECINRHLLTIFTYVDENEEAKNALASFSNNADPLANALSAIDRSSAEGEYIGNLMEKFTSKAQQLQNCNITSPMEGLQHFMASGLIKDLFETLGNQQQAQNIDKAKMARMMYQAIGTMLPPDSSSSSVPVSNPPTPETNVEMIVDAPVVRKKSKKKSG